jgi:metal-responsive CopG/Arc/MetJ family transcriptional regulator
MQTQRINITLPNDLARDLRKTIPARSRSKFISEALKERLSKKKKFTNKEWIKALKANYEADKKIAAEIEEDFKYADAEILERIP